VSDDRRPGARAAIAELAQDRDQAAWRSVAEGGQTPLSSLADGGQATIGHGHYGRATLLAAALVAVATFAAQALLVSAFTHARRSNPPTVAVVPYWNFSRGLSTALANKDELTMVSPWMYGVTASATVTPLDAAAAARASGALAKLRASGLKLVPTIANFRDGAWQYGLVAPILHDREQMRRHVRAITRLVTAQHLDGVDIDYEDLRASDRDAFSTFISALAGALHRRGKILAVDVFAKASDAGYDQRNRAQDYRALGQAADQVRLMAYDDHWTTSSPGPVAPIGWVNQVLAYATREIPAKKIILGVPMYGYDWSAGEGTSVTWLQVFGLLRAHPVPVHWDAASQSPWLRYTDRDGRRHELWFENAYSASVKFDAAHRHGIGGVYLWMFGDADALTWTKLREHWTNGPATSPTATPGARS
jgi:spore germination protein